MTRRLALAILLIVWATLIAGGMVAYLTTRSVLLADLDASLIARARSLPELSGATQAAARIEEAEGDRYIISNNLGQTRGRMAPPSESAPQPLVVRASLSKLGDGQAVRTLTLRFNLRESGQPVTVVYSGSAQRFCGVLDRLALALAVFGAAAGIAAAGVAVAVSRAALRPLRGTADVIGSINERKLDRRIDASALPPELHPVAARLNEMLLRLQQAFAQRKQFLADASHELRTPVAALVTTIEVALRRPRDAATLTRALQTCLTDAEMLRQLVQTLLVHARGESPQMQEKDEVFDVVTVLNQCADVADGLALAKGVTIHRYLPEALEINSQPQRLRGIVMNLLGNAVEYNRFGGSVDLKIEVQDADLELSVSDSGRGIAAEHVPHVFQPFYRAGGASSALTAPLSSPVEAPMPSPAGTPADVPHLGLGLFLVDSNVKAMGGECKIESVLGSGTTMRVRLPQVVASEPAILEGAAV